VDIEKKTESMLSESYQRILTFRTDDGGFVVWGGGGCCGDIHYTALAMMQLAEMSKVTYIDPAVIAKAAEFVATQQAEDGTWGNGWEGESGLMRTASIAWALAAAGYQGQVLDKALAALADKAPAAPVYTRALAGVALALSGQYPEALSAIISSLAQDVVVDGDVAHWVSGESTLFGSHGETADVTGTGVVAYLLLLTGEELDLAEMAVDYILKQKQRGGGWGATESTVAALRALALSGVIASGTVTVSCGGQEFASLPIEAQNADILNVVDLDACMTQSQNPWSFSFDGIGKIQYQYEACYNTPFEDEPEPPDGFAIDVSVVPPDPQEGDTVTVGVTVGNPTGTDHGMSIVSIPVPLGMSVKGSDLDALKEAGTLGEWEVRDRSVVVYLEDFPDGAEVSFAYGMAAVLPVKTTVAPATVYSYYTPEVRAVTQPYDMLVKAK
jgi:uncharacterized protein YfaS (alpha-2-macroglobulin family)